MPVFAVEVSMEKAERPDDSHAVMPEVERQLRLADAAVQARRPDVVVRACRALLDAHPGFDFPAVHAKPGFALLGLRRYAEAAAHFAQALETHPDAVLDVRYEELVRDTEAQVRRMLEHLGLEWNAACLDFPRNRRVVETASLAQVRQPIYRDSVARWRRFEAHLQPLMALVAPWR